MSGSSADAKVERSAVGRAFVEAVESNTPERARDCYTEDALFDAHVPNWRFQVEGADAVVETLGGWFPTTGRFVQWDEEETAAGDLLIRLEWREREGTPDEVRSREMQLWHLEDGKIREQIIYCSGRWDQALVEQMAAEAPLVRP